MARSRSTDHRLLEALNAGGCPVFILDDERRIVFWNDACAAWTGLDAAAMVGQRCVYQAPDGLTGEVVSQQPAFAAALAAALCPPPESLTGQRRRVWRQAWLASERRVAGWVEYLPLTTTVGDMASADDTASAGDTAPIVALVATASADSVESAPPGVGGASATEPDAEALHAQLAQFRAALGRRYMPEQFVGADPRIVRARTQAGLAACSNASVLITGPPGVGKEHLARAIHYARYGTAQAIWAPLACSALGAELLWSTLQALVEKTPRQKTAEAHPAEKTAAVTATREQDSTPADRVIGPAADDRDAMRGTVLLNDVDQLPAEVQTPLADLLASGGLRMRVIATASRSLVELASEGTFDEALAYRLSTIEIDVPGLAARIADLPLLAQALVERLNAEGAKQLAGVAPETLDFLAACAWPGNVDELAEALRAAHAVAEGVLIAPVDLPKGVRLAVEARVRPPRPVEPIQLETFLADVERELIERALRRAKGNKSRAAKLLGLTRPRLYRRLRELGLDPAPLESQPPKRAASRDALGAPTQPTPEEQRSATERDLDAPCAHFDPPE